MSDAIPMSEAKRLLLQKMLAGGNVARTEIVPPVTARPADAVPPISAEQMNVWVHQSMAPDQPLYNESITIHRRGSFDLALLERSFNEILRRHEIWRSAFANVDGEIVQIVAPELRQHSTERYQHAAGRRSRGRGDPARQGRCALGHRPHPGAAVPFARRAHGAG